jgi:O-antigen/teichoic acid export membrane protein
VVPVALPALRTRLLQGGLWAAGGRAATALTTLLVNFLLARVLQPAALGQYFFILSVVRIAYVAAMLGLGQTLIRVLAGGEAREQVRPAVRAAWRWGLLGTGLTGLALGVGGWLMGYAPVEIGLTVAWLTMLALGVLWAEALRGLHDLRASMAFSGLAAGVAACLALGLAWGLQRPLSLAEVLGIQAGGQALSLLGAWLVMAAKLRAYPVGAELAGGAAWLGQALPVMLASLVQEALLWVDIWVLSAAAPPAEVAVYGAASRLAAAAALPLNIVNLFAPPLIAELASQGQVRQLEHMLRRLALLAGIPGGLAALVFILGGGPVLSWLYGSYYGSGALALGLLSVGQLVNLWTGACAQTLVMTGQPRALMVCALAGGLLAVGLAAALVRPCGMAGVAAAMTVGLAAQNLAALLAARKLTGIWTMIG